MLLRAYLNLILINYVMSAHSSIYISTYNGPSTNGIFCMKLFFNDFDSPSIINHTT